MSCSCFEQLERWRGGKGSLWYMYVSWYLKVSRQHACKQTCCRQLLARPFSLYYWLVWAQVTPSPSHTLSVWLTPTYFNLPTHMCRSTTLLLFNLARYTPQSQEKNGLHGDHEYKLLFQCQKSGVTNQIRDLNISTLLLSNSVHEYITSV